MTKLIDKINHNNVEKVDNKNLRDESYRILLEVFNLFVNLLNLNFEQFELKFSEHKKQ